MNYPVNVLETLILVDGYVIIYYYMYEKIVNIHSVLADR